MRQLSMWLFGLAALSQAAEVPAGSVFCVRLMHAVSSDRMRPGDPVQATLVAPIELGGAVLLPARTPVTGVVRAARNVGLGLKRERASLEIAFTAVSPAGMDAVPIAARVTLVDNARESVNKLGVVRGTLATETPQTFISHRVFQFAFLNPVPNPVRLVSQGVFPFFPQPEIRLPTGTDLWLTLSEPLLLPDPPSLEPAAPPPAVDVSKIPARVLSKKDKPADVVNLAFVATEQELDEAFANAGWDPAHEPSMRTFLCSVRNVFEQRYHPNQPMSRMKLFGRFADRGYQRGLNTYTKRHHLRIWKTGEEVDGKPVWVGAATHDIGLRFLWRRFHMTHAVAPEIDLERAKVGTDLAFSGCVANAGLLPRADMPAIVRNAEGAMLHTDGGVLAMTLKPCEHARVGSPEEARMLAKADMPWVKRLVQRQMLLLRGDVLRLNLVWSAFTFSKKAVATLVHPRRHRNPAAATMIPSSLWSPGTEKVLSTSRTSVAVSPAGSNGFVSTISAPEFE